MALIKSRSPKELDVLLSRILVGRPKATPEDIRRLVPETAGMDDRALSQKLEYLNRHLPKIAPARS